MNSRKHIAIIGATSKIAEHCARLWAEDQPVLLSLVGRNRDKLKRIVDDLRVRSPQSEISSFEADFVIPEKINAMVNHIGSIAPVDIVLIAHGYLPNQSECQHDLKKAADVMFINSISPVLFAEAFARQMEQNNQGTIALIGSVAGDRGRKSNYFYGAAKGLVTRYAQGLQHHFTGKGVKVLLIKPGPTDTPMTANMKTAGIKLASAEQVAKDIVIAIEKGKPLVYTPKKWWLIMMIATHLPAFIFNRLNI